MIVTLYLGEKPIESRFVRKESLQVPGYFEGLQKDMIEQNEDIMDLSKETPNFKIDEVTIRKPIRN